jgi:hypothetical protein
LSGWPGSDDPHANPDEGAANAGTDRHALTTTYGHASAHVDGDPGGDAHPHAVA